MKRLLFIDRDGTLIREPADEQIDSFEKLEFMPGMIRALSDICRHTDYELVMVSNQDGLGTISFPEENFWPVQNFLMQTLEGEGIRFSHTYIDRHFPSDNAPTRKPGTAMLTHYLDGTYDLTHSYVIGDRDTDAQLAHNLGCGALIIGRDGTDWPRIAEIVIAGTRCAALHRKTTETDVSIKINLDGSGKCDIDTGLPFFDHMLAQLPHHGQLDLCIHARGDIEVDPHHTIEDVAIVLGQCLNQAMADKRGAARYGFVLPMDDCLCRVALDFGGRAWLSWHAKFKTPAVGNIPTEMFHHFFDTLAHHAAINLHIKAKGHNEHHKIEGIFKAFARALHMAKQRDVEHMSLPSSKGTL